MITPAHVQQAFASHHLALHRFAKAPALCDRAGCTSFEIWGATFTYLATSGKPDFVVVVLPTVADAARIARVSTSRVERHRNLLLLSVRSAAARLATVRRIFSTL